MLYERIALLVEVDVVVVALVVAQASGAGAAAVCAPSLIFSAGPETEFRFR